MTKASVSSRRAVISMLYSTLVIPGCGLGGTGGRGGGGGGAGGFGLFAAWLRSSRIFLVLQLRIVHLLNLVLRMEWTPIAYHRS